VLGGPLGIGKSSILKIVFGAYCPDAGRILLADGDGFLDIAGASSREVIRARRCIMGYVSQFLRVIPRVAGIDIAAAAQEAGLEPEAARARAALLMSRLNLPNVCGGCRQRHSPAASSNGSTSPAASPATTRCSSSMNRPPLSTSKIATPRSN
jgi:alpha-D-ribose 1-methylphosphonate 5-triphosphate synthase subunit PhnL